MTCDNHNDTHCVALMYIIEDIIVFTNHVVPQFHATDSVTFGTEMETVW